MANEYYRANHAEEPTNGQRHVANKTPKQSLHWRFKVGGGGQPRFGKNCYFWSFQGYTTIPSGPNG